MVEKHLGFIWLDGRVEHGQEFFFGETICSRGVLLARYDFIRKFRNFIRLMVCLALNLMDTVDHFPYEIGFSVEALLVKGLGNFLDRIDV